MYRVKNDYIGMVPKINNPGVKTHPKYKKFVEAVQNAHKAEMAKA